MFTYAKKAQKPGSTPVTRALKGPPARGWSYVRGPFAEVMRSSRDAEAARHAKADGAIASDRSAVAPAPVEVRDVGAETPVAVGAREELGSIPDIVTPEGEGRSTGAELEEEVAADMPDRSTGAPGNVIANISIGVLASRAAKQAQVGKHDPVRSGVSIGTFSQPGGLTVGRFGAELYEPRFSGISYSFASGKCTVSAWLDPVCPWGTNGTGRIDVPSANAPVVTAATAHDIARDLTPSAASPHRSPRSHYYSQALVERHEKFHGTDDFRWTRSSGLAIVRAYLEAGTVQPGSAATDVATLLDGARRKLIAENLAWYKGTGTSHDQYDGEIRAYADGRPAYQALADGVRARGVGLSAAAAGQAAGRAAAEASAAASARGRIQP